MPSVPEELFGRWIHSHEEDTADTRVYRPASYRFRPSRGRRGFEIKTDGEFVRYAIAAADGSRPVPGRWTAESPSRIHVSFAEGEGEPETLEVLAVDREVLKLKK